MIFLSYSTLLLISFVASKVLQRQLVPNMFKYFKGFVEHCKKKEYEKYENVRNLKETSDVESNKYCIYKTPTQEKSFTLSYFISVERFIKLNVNVNPSSNPCCRPLKQKSYIWPSNNPNVKCDKVH